MERSLFLLLVELILSLFVLRKSEFLDNDFGTNQTQNINFQKRFPVVQMHSMCQVAGVCRGDNLEALLVDWERKTISHCDLIPLLEILLTHSQFHLSLHVLHLYSEPLYCLMTFS